MKKTGVIFGVIFLAALLVATSLQAQFVASGGVVSKIKWMEAKGDTYKVIYPEGADSLATRYLWHLEQNKPAVMLGLDVDKPATIPVVLYNTTMWSNGKVVWAPKRMELFTLPPQQTYPIMWDEQLAVHESRHVGQMTHFTKGIFKIGSVPIGEQSPSLGVAIYPSRWFLEGDAVIAETELTNAGRGRSAEFMEYYRASFLEGEIRSWEKWKQRSFRHYTPDRYAFGYFVGSTVRYKTGKYGYAGEMMDVLVDNFYNPWVRNMSYRKVAGDTPRNYLKQGINMMGDYWREELSHRGRLTQPKKLLHDKVKDYREYSSPVMVGKDSLVYIKRSYDGFASLVLISGGKETMLDGISSSVVTIKGAAGKVWFAEKVANARWSNEVYGDIYSFDIQNREFERITQKRYYAHVQPQGNGEILQAVAYNPFGGTSLELVNSNSGEIVARYSAPDNGNITSTAFLNGIIYALCVTDQGLGLFKLDNGEWNREINEQSAVIEELGSGNGYLYFLSDMDGVRNVYMYYPQNGELVRATNSKYGASAPLVMDGKVYYSDLQLNERIPVVADVEEAGACGSEFEPQLIGGKIEGAYKYFVAEELTAQAKAALREKGLLAEDSVKGVSIVKYSVPYDEFASSVEKRNYSKLGHLFRFHSWAPLYYNVDKLMTADYDNLYDVISPGATIYSQNTLGTAVAMLGYAYNRGRNEGHFKMEYSGWYPVVQFSADVNDGNRTFYKVVAEESSAKVEYAISDEPLVELKAMAYIPLNLSCNGWNRSVVPMLQWEYSNVSFYSYNTEKFHPTNALSAAVQYYQLRDVAHSGVFPKWGYGGKVSWRGMIDMEENYGSQLGLDIYGYLPGFATNHGIRLGMQLQQQFNDGKLFYISNLVEMPRGYTEDIYGEKYIKASVDYAFPLYLGDINIARVIFLKRMRIIPYFDFAVNAVSEGRETKSVNLYSYGSDVLVDFSPFAIGLDVGLGIRYSRNGNNGGVPVPANTWQILFSTTLF